MKKKLMILALCIGMLTATTAGAQKIEIEKNSQKVNFSDSISTEEALVICFVVKKGESIDNDANVYALKNTRVKDGKIEIAFTMPEEKNEQLSDGEYDIYIKEEGKAVRTGSFVYASLQTRIRLLNALKGVTSYEELKAVLENENNLTALKAIGCETDYYNENTAANMYASIQDMTAITLEIAEKEYNKACVKDAFGNADTNKADELLKVANPEFEGVAYEDIEDAGLTAWLSAYFSKNAYSDENYKTANILYKFNSSVSDKLDDLFAAYAGDMGVTGDARYIAYNSLGQKAVVNGVIAETLAVKPANSVNDLLDVVNSAVLSIGSGGGSNGGGGGGGNSSSGRLSAATGIPAADNVANGSPVLKDLHQAEWAVNAITGLVRAGIVAGDENGNFRPNDYITREEYVKMLVLAAGKYDENAACDFSDVPKAAWYYSYVASANECGITHGINETEFGVGVSLTRQDMAVLSLNAKGGVQEVRGDVAFADGESIADYAKEAVSKLYMAGVVNGIGDNMFDPLGLATRAECAQIIYNLFLK